MVWSKLLVSMSLCVLLCVPANAMPRNFGQIDLDRNGTLYQNEPASAVSERNAALMLSRCDGNGDDVLSAGELRSLRDDGETHDDECDDGESNSGGHKECED